MRKILLTLLMSVLMIGCSFATEYEVAIANRCDHDVTVSTTDHVQKQTLHPDEVMFVYSNDDCFVVITDIKIRGYYDNGQGWVDVQRMYFESNNTDRQLEICEDGFWLDDKFIEPMDWN